MNKIFRNISASELFATNIGVSGAPIPPNGPGEKNPLIKDITVINLEAALSGFAGGFTSQQVIITLARHNAVFAYIIEEHFKVKVNLLSVNTMRKQLFGKCRIKGVKSKDFVKLELEKLIPEVIDFSVLNKKGNWDEKNGDMYDGIVCSLYKIT